jgi:hypothetical protein
MVRHIRIPNIVYHDHEHMWRTGICPQNQSKENEDTTKHLNQY